MKMTADVSPCGLYRYDLTRTWDFFLPVLGVILLNPSTADAEKNDPTVTRLMKRAKMNGFGGVRLGNLFAYRSTDPMTMIWQDSFVDIVGPKNDESIVAIAKSCPTVLCGWGVHGWYAGRGPIVRDLIRPMTNTVILGITGAGQPRHPLYIPYKGKDGNPLPLEAWV